MTNQNNKLAELAAPTRGRIKYAPLTAGLLARKGEALPATPYYAAEALDLYTAGPIVVARHEPVQHLHAAHAPTAHSHESTEHPHRARGAQMQPWRMRRPTLAPEPHVDSGSAEWHEVKPPAEPDRNVHKPEAVASHDVGQVQRLALSIEFDLDLIARLALHARHEAKTPAQLLEEALREHLGHKAEMCPTCARSLGEHNS
ncbi:MAG: hypothetical protein WAW96_18245 [Alphaproteobacteria bacterium]